MFAISENYAARTVLGECIIVPITGSCDNNTGFITVNESGKIIIDALLSGKTREEAAAALCEEYETDSETAAADVEEFITSFKQAGVLIEK